MTTTVLVLGATGKSGRRLVPLLQARGVTVRAASRQANAHHTLFDWYQPETHQAALEGVDAVYLISPDFVEDPSSVIAPFLDRAKQLGVKRVVAVSSLGVSFPHEPEDSGRRKVEQLVMASGMEWTLLRAGGFSQNFSESFFLPGILHADAVATATGDGAVAFVDAEDIAAIAAVALTEHGHAQAIYSVTGSQSLTFAQAAAVISKAAGREISHRPIASSEFAAILQGGGVPADYAAVVVRDQEAIRAGAGAVVTDVVERVTGRPPISFETYAANAAAAWVRV